MAHTRIYLKLKSMRNVRSGGNTLQRWIDHMMRELAADMVHQQTSEYPEPSVGFSAANDSSGTVCYLQYDSILPELPAALRRSTRFRVVRVMYADVRQVITDGVAETLPFDVSEATLESALVKYECVCRIGEPDDEE